MRDDKSAELAGEAPNTEDIPEVAPEAGEQPAEEGLASTETPSVDEAEEVVRDSRPESEPKQGEGDENADEAADTKEQEPVQAEELPAGSTGSGGTPDADDSGHIADIVSEGGEAVDGALVWSASGRKFRIVPMDGSPLSEETGQILSLLDAKRLAFDGAEEQSEFVDRMSERGVDVDNDRIAMDMDSSTSELLIDPELLTSNYRHHPSDGSETVVWPDEIDLDDPAMREAVEETPGGTGNLGDALKPDGDEKPEGDSGKGERNKADDIMTLVALAVVALFFLFVLIVQRPSVPVLVVWAIMCVAAALTLLMPLTLGKRGRDGSKAALAAGVATVFALMLAGMMIDAVTSGRFSEAADQARDAIPGKTEQKEGPDSGNETQTIDMSSPSDMAIVRVTGTGAEYPGVAVGGMLVTSGEVGQASSVTVSLAGKSYAARRVMTIDRLGISVIEVDGDISPHVMGPADSVSIGEKGIAMSANGNGTITVEGVVVRGTTLAIGDKVDSGGSPETFFIDLGFRAGTVIVDSDEKLLGILPKDGEEAVSGTAIAREVDNLLHQPAPAPDDGKQLPHIGISCRDADGEGAYVEGVEPGTPASNAGVMTRDVIRSVNEKDVHSVREYEDALRDLRPDEKMKLGVLRDGKRIEIEIDMP